MIDNKTIRKVIMLNKMLPGGSPTYENREATGTVANFTTNVAMPFVKCECEILPIQEGTGTPSPSNPRPISGTDELMLTHTNYRTAETYTFDLGQTVYSGMADVVGGTGSKTSATILIKDLSLSRHSTYGSFYASIPEKAQTNTGMLCECLNVKNGSNVSTQTIMNEPNFTIGQNNANTNIYIRADDYANVSELKAALGEYKIEFILATPTPFTFTGQPINSYLGVNNVWTKSGDTKVTYKYQTGEGGSSTKKYLPIFYDLYGKEKYKCL